MRLEMWTNNHCPMFFGYSIDYQEDMTRFWILIVHKWGKKYNVRDWSLFKETGNYVLVNAVWKVLKDNTVKLGQNKVIGTRRIIPDGLFAFNNKIGIKKSL